MFFTLTWRWGKTTQVHCQSILQRSHHPVELLHQKRTTQKDLSNIMTVIVVQARITGMSHILRSRCSARINSPSASYTPAAATEFYEDCCGYNSFKKTWQLYFMQLPALEETTI